MNVKELYREIEVFSEETHGSSDYDKNEIFVMGVTNKQFAPLKYLKKKLEFLDDSSVLLSNGFIYDSYDFLGGGNFQEWYERQFGKKLLRRVSKKIFVIHAPDNKSIIDSIENIDKAYNVLRDNDIIINGKNLPVQLGEWYAKCIFGLKQNKSTSQRGFDFSLNEKRTEVKVSYSDFSSPKGVKIKKSLIDLSDYCVIIYLANNFMVREVCFLDSNYILRKFSGKGHTIFLKDSDLSTYFFSKSSKHIDKVMNSSSLLKFSSPTLAMKLAEKF